MSLSNLARLTEHVASCEPMAEYALVVGFKKMEDVYATTRAPVIRRFNDDTRTAMNELTCKLI